MDWGAAAEIYYTNKKNALETNSCAASFICFRGKWDFLSANIVCGKEGSLLEKKKQWKEWDAWKIHILNCWTKTAGSFFSFLPSHFHLGFKKPQFDIGFRSKFVKKHTARKHAWNSH